jgi:lactate dehydrogenase-like 2-hydroxyacid dehydrogenase
LPTGNSQAGDGSCAEGSIDMKIAVIGTGNVGKAIGGSLVRARHR